LKIPISSRTEMVWATGRSRGPQRGEDLRVPDDVALDVAGEDEFQAAVETKRMLRPQLRVSASRWARYFALASHGLARSASARDSWL
jgi:hypothetical protein